MLVDLAIDLFASNPKLFASGDEHLASAPYVDTKFH